MLGLFTSQMNQRFIRAKTPQPRYSRWYLTLLGDDRAALEDLTTPDSACLGALDRAGINRPAALTGLRCDRVTD